MCLLRKSPAAGHSRERCANHGSHCAADRARCLETNMRPSSSPITAADQPLCLRESTLQHPQLLNLILLTRQSIAEHCCEVHDGGSGNRPRQNSSLYVPAPGSFTRMAARQARCVSMKRTIAGHFTPQSMRQRFASGTHARSACRHHRPDQSGNEQQQSFGLGHARRCGSE